MEIVSEVNLMMLRSSQDHLGPFEAILGLFLGLNLKLRQTSHVTTQNDRKRSTIPIKRVSEVNLKTLWSFKTIWDLLRPFAPHVVQLSCSKYPKLVPNGPEMTSVS